MARRKRIAAPAVPEVDDRELERRLHHLHQAFFPGCCVEESPGRAQLEQSYSALARFRAGLERRALPLVDQVAAVEDWLQERGWLERAVRHVEHLDRARERWAGGL